MVKFVAFFSTACLICLLVAAVVYLRASRMGGARQTLDSPAVVKEIRQLNELVTVRYGIEKVVGMKEEKSPVGSESILLLVQGKVLAGVDLAQLTPADVTMFKGDAVRVHLSPPHIQEAFLDEKYTKVWDRSITWWTPWVTPDVDLEHKARMQALEDIKKAALDMGILGEAQRNAETDIRNILRAFGIEKVDFGYGT
jgi:hypothetical protein